MHIPILTIVRKELWELGSRPWQVLTLILGPLAIMVCFGIGSNPIAAPPTALVVVPPGQELPQLLRDYQRQFEQSLRIVGYVTDEQLAREQLRRDAVDAVVILPHAPFRTIAGGEQATIRVLYNEIDPIWRLTVPNFTWILATEINRAILLQNLGTQREALDIATRDVVTVLEVLELAIEAADAGDSVALGRLLGEAATRSAAIEAALARLGPEAAALRERVARVRQRLEQAERQLATLGATLDLENGRPLREQLGLVDGVTRLRQLRETLRTLTALPPEVVVTPLAIEARNVARLEPDLVTFYAPGIVALLVQHIAVSLGTLAFVRERLAGTFDLYAVAPIATAQLLLGKYLAYLACTLAVAAAVLIVLLVGLQVPLLGSPWRLLLVLVVLALASVGLGLAFSLLATSERQAVQFALLALLAVVFFSGFTLPLHALRQPALTIAYSLPATYGTVLLQDVMLRGVGGSAMALGALVALAAVLFVLCQALLLWRVRPR